jgi:predicted membrane channel-forming protein YqfA (hemolysin III family)
MSSLLLFTLAILSLVAGYLLFQADNGWGFLAMLIGLVLFLVGAVVNHEEHTRR